MHDPPWTEVGREDEPYLGIEVALARQLADELGARIEWRAAGESRLMEALANYELDLVIGGLTDSSAWHKHVGLTRPYVRAPSMPEAEPGRTAAKDVGHVFAVPPGENEWLLVVEKFLERKRTEIARLIDRPMSEDQG
jgi:ABC-type amino acid transport substrate-binding protein